MNGPALMLRPSLHGWAVYLTDGRELVRFNGPGAKRRALRYLARITQGSALRQPARLSHRSLGRAAAGVTRSWRDVWVAMERRT
jgi:hypothetical protein